MGDTETVAKRLGQEDKLSVNMKERAAERRSKAIYMDAIDRHRAKLDQDRLAKKHGALEDNSQEMANADDETRLRIAHKNAKARRKIIAEQSQAHKKEGLSGHSDLHTGKKKEKPKPYWECPVCTLENESKAVRCVQCNARPTTVAVVDDHDNVIIKSLGADIGKYERKGTLAELEDETLDPHRSRGKKTKDSFGRRRYMEELHTFDVDNDYEKTDGIATKNMDKARNLDDTFKSRNPIHGSKCQSCGGHVVLSSAWYKALKNPRAYKYCRECIEGSQAQLSADSVDDMNLANAVTHVELEVGKERSEIWMGRMLKNNEDPTRELAHPSQCWKCGSHDPGSKSGAWHHHPGTRHKVCVSCAEELQHNATQIGKERFYREGAEIMNHHLDTHTIMQKRHITRPADEKIGVKGRHGTSAYDASPHKFDAVDKMVGSLPILASQIAEGRAKKEKRPRRHRGEG